MMLTIARFKQKNKSLYVAMKLFSVGVGVLQMVILSRGYAPDLFGRFSFFLTVGILLIILTDFGMMGLTTRELIKKTFDFKEILVSTTVLKFAILLPLSSIAIAWGAFKGEFQLYWILAGCLWVLAEGIKLNCFALFRAKDNFILEAKILGAFSLSFLLIISLAAYFSLPMVCIVFGLALLSGLMGSYVWFYTVRTYGPLKFDLSNIFLRLKQLRRAVLPFFLISMISFLFSRLDSLMIKLLDTYSAVAYYEAASSLNRNLVMIPSIFATIFFPTFCSSWHDKKVLKGHLRRLSLGVGGIALLLVGAQFLMGEKIVLLVFSSKYVPAIRTMYLLIALTVPLFFNTILSLFLLAVNQERVVLRILIFSIFLNIALNLLLIPSWGIWGAGLGTVVSEVVVLLGTLFCLNRFFKKGDEG